MPKKNQQSFSSQRRIAALESSVKMLELRKTGMTYARIADAMGCSIKTVHDGLKRAMKAIITEPAEEFRQLELERLDALLLGLWKNAKDGHLGSVDRVLKIMERRAKLLGLDSPVKFEGDMKNTGGVLLVPGAMTPEDWSKVAAAQQAALAAEPAPDQDQGLE